MKMKKINSKKIYVIGTGGTIAMEQKHGLTPALSIDKLLGKVDADYKVEAYELCNIDGRNMPGRNSSVSYSSSADDYQLNIIGADVA